MIIKKISIFLLFSFLFAPIFPIYATKTAVLPIKPIKILLVPGHDDTVWGAQYGNMKEADMTLALATKIYNLLKKDKRFEVYITRDQDGYVKEFADYFAEHQADILSFKDKAKKQTLSEIISGIFIPKKNVPHVGVSEDTSIKLYGINKWADENKMDAVIHIHFNDYPRPSKWTIGTYKGFVVYFPDGQLANSKESANLATDIFDQLRKKYATSTYPPEAGGLVSDQKLIAVGANNTLDASVRSVLIEYSYIYEKKFRTNSARSQAYTSMASLTATGIKNYFFQTSP
jgi:N-acetylmuramoyl-L-alanine amidase